MMHLQANAVEQQSYTFVNDQGTERKKRFSNKTRTGCDTCKKRRVKCDEGKPTCANCNRGGRRCEGYQRAAVGIPWHRLLRQHQKQTDTAYFQFHQQVTQTFGKAGESQWLERWFNNTATEVAKFSNPYFWYALIPQVSWYHESVRNALIAVAIACDESYNTHKHLNGSKALYYYNQSICALTRSNKDKSTPAEIVLLCSILFWLFENIKNRPCIAMTHLKAAVNMLNEHTRKPPYQDDLLASYIEPVLQEGMVLASTALPTGGRHRHQALLTGEAFLYALTGLEPNPKPKDVHDAQVSFNKCQQATLIAKKMAMSPNSPNPDFIPLRALYSRWKKATDSHSEHWPQEPVRLLNMHYYMHMMAIDLVETELERGNIRREASWRSRLQYLLNEAKHFANLATEKGYSTVNLPTISVLSFTARQCTEQNNDIAEEALATLENNEFFEGIWNSRVAAEVVRLMRKVDLEHECCNKGDLEAVFERAAFIKVTD